MINERDILSHLTRITYPGSRHDIVSLGLIRHVRIANEGEVLLHFRSSSAENDILQQLAGEITTLLNAVPGVKRVEIHAGPAHSETAPASSAAAPAQGALPGVRHIVAVA